MFAFFFIFIPRLVQDFKQALVPVVLVRKALNSFRVRVRRISCQECKNMQKRVEAKSPICPGCWSNLSIYLSMYSIATQKVEVIMV